MKRLMIFLLAGVLPHQIVVADPVDFIAVEPESGLIESNGSSISVTATTDGHLVEYSLANREGASPSEFLIFNSSWNSSQWTEFSVRQRTPDIGGTSFVRVHWAPWDDTPLSANPGSSLRLQPNLDYTIALGLQEFCETCEPESFIFEYSVNTVEPPLVGDFDDDDDVDMDDFLTLSDSYGSGHFIFWKDGDADMNGVVDFPDFLLMSANFGTTRESTAAFAVPEPSSVALVSIGLLGLALLRRRR